MNSSSHPQPGYAASPASSNAQTTVSTSFEVVTSVGVTIRTFGTEDLARTWLAQNKTRLPGAVVFRIVTTQERKPVYRPRTLEVVK